MDSVTRTNAFSIVAFIETALTVGAKDVVLTAVHTKEDTLTIVTTTANATAGCVWIGLAHSATGIANRLIATRTQTVNATFPVKGQVPSAKWRERILTLAIRGLCTAAAGPKSDATSTNASLN